MRIPTSMIVMGVLTAIPFGLAIRSTMKEPAHKSGHSVLDEDEPPSEEDYERRIAEEQVASTERRHKEEMEEAAHKAEIMTHWRAVIGASPASLGTLFDGLVLGGTADAIEARNDAVRPESAYELAISFEQDVKNAIGVKIRVGGYRHECEGFDEMLKTAWGPALPGDSEHLAWSTGSQRAVFQTAECTLWVERFVEAPKWIGHGDTIVPVDYVGKTAKSLIAKLGPAVDSDDTAITWSGMSVGATSTGVTGLNAEVENGKITSINVHLDMDVLTRGTVVDQLNKVFGKAKEAAADYGDSVNLSWMNGRTPIEMSTTATSIDLRIGK